MICTDGRPVTVHFDDDGPFGSIEVYRLHRFGQRHAEVRIFNMVAEGTREGDVLSTLLTKLDEARKDLCSDKVELRYRIIRGCTT